MVLGVDLDTACERMGHRRKTRTREIVAALGVHALAKRLITHRGADLPETAVLRIRTASGSLGHFVLKDVSVIHDPVLPRATTIEAWELLTGTRDLRVTSFLPIRLS